MVQNSLCPPLYPKFILNHEAAFPVAPTQVGSDVRYAGSSVAWVMERKEDGTA